MDSYKKRGCERLWVYGYLGLGFLGLQFPWRAQTESVDLEYHFTTFLYCQHLDYHNLAHDIIVNVCKPFLYICGQMLVFIAHPFLPWTVWLTRLFSRVINHWWAWNSIGTRVGKDVRFLVLRNSSALDMFYNYLVCIITNTKSCYLFWILCCSEKWIPNLLRTENKVFD